MAQEFSEMASRAGRMRSLRLLNNLGPQVKCEVLSLGDTQVGRHFALVALPDTDIQRHRRIKSALNQAVSRGRGGEVVRVPGHPEPSERTIGVSSAVFVLVKRGHRYVRLEAAGNVLNVPSQPPKEHYDHIQKTARK